MADRDPPTTWEVNNTFMVQNTNKKSVKNEDLKESKKIRIKRFLKSFVDSIVKHPYKILIIVFIFYLLQWFWGFEASFFISLFFLFLLLRWEFRILFAFALLFLVSCPFFLIAGKEHKLKV